METATRLARTADLDRAAEVLGDAFADYAWTRWTVDASDHVRRLAGLQRLALEHVALPFGGVSVSTVNGVVQSVAAWSDSARVSAAPVDASVISAVAELEGNRHEASKAADRSVDPLRPRTRHLYLGTVGTSRAMQGRGLGTLALAPLFRSSGETGLDVWLETSNESNVAFYERLGFDVNGHVAIDGGGPEVWLMRRRPTAR